VRWLVSDEKVIRIAVRTAVSLAFDVLGVIFGAHQFLQGSVACPAKIRPGPFYLGRARFVMR